MTRRMRALAAALIMAALVAGLTAPVVAAAPDPAGPARDGGARLDAPDRVKVIVTFRAKPGARELKLLRDMGARIRHVYQIIPGAAVEVPAAVLAALERNPLVRAVETDHRLAAFDHAAATGDPELEAAWGVEHIGAGTVHAAPTGNRGAGIRVAVVDTGIECTHPDLAANCGGGYNFFANLPFPGGIPFDDHGHGTHVAGTIAALRNGVGVVGVAPEAQVVALKVLGADGSGDYSGLIAALDWAAQPANDIDIVNMSLGGSEPSAALEQAVHSAGAAGIVLVAASGNVGDIFQLLFGCPVAYPAHYPEVLATTFTDGNDALTGYSCTGPEVDFASPGDNITSTLPSVNCAFCSPTGYGAASGTSMASPHLAGSVALLLAAGIVDQNGNGRQDEARDRLCATADDGFGVLTTPIPTTDPRYPTYFGCGIPNVDEAVLGLAPPPPPPANAPPTAVADPAATSEDASVLIDVRANDSDPDGDALTLTAVTQPASGTAVIESGSVRYTPTSNWYGTDAFTYTVSDGRGGSASAAVTVTVSSVNDLPTAQAGSGSTLAGVALPITLRGSDVESCATLAFEIVGGPTHGSLGAVGGTTCSAGVSSAALTYTPGAGYSGPDSFTFRVRDGDGAVSAVATVSITVSLLPEIHVTDLDGVRSRIDSRRWRVDITVTVQSGATNVAGARVTFTYKGTYSGTVACTTDTAGTCPIGGTAQGKTVTFTVSGISASGYIYDATRNGDPDGDSTGTKITIARP